MIVKNIAPESVDVYLFLSEQFSRGDVRTNYLLQFGFRSFYRIDNAGLIHEFKKKYFELTEHANEPGKLNLECLSRELYKHPNLKGNSTLQFFFVSKLAHTVDASYPIFESEIAGLYGLKRPANRKEFDERLNDYLTFYSKLKSDYDDVLEKEVLQVAFK